MGEQMGSLKTGIKYKDTPIGKIPVDWEVVRLGDICNVIGGSTPSTNKREYWNGEIPFATPTDITNLKGREISGTEQRITLEGLSSCGTNLLPVGTILLTSRATIGACAINTKPMATNQGFASLVCNERAYNWFIFYKISSLISELQRLGSGSTFKEVSKTSIRSLIFALPPISEQKKIAEILTTVDEVIEETAQVIEKTKEVKKGVMQKLLTRGIGHKKFKKTEIGGIPEEWEVRKLGGLCIGEPEYGANVPATNKDKNFPRYIRITDVTEGGKLLESTWQSINIQFAQPYLLEEGDFLFARSGATVGKTYLYKKKDGKCAFAGYMIRFKPNPKELLPDYLFQYTHSNFYYNWVKGILRAGAQPNINAQEYFNMPLPKPPIDEQEQIGRILSSIDEEIEKESLNKEQLESLKKGLMQVLLTGKIRVVL
jgi:type I restriction enzyme S subunit